MPGLHKIRWKVVGKVGYFWDGPEVDLGTYRWRWYAFLKAHAWLAKWSYSRALVSKIEVA